MALTAGPDPTCSTLAWADHLDPQQVLEVLRLADAAAAADGAYPLSEHVLLHLGNGGDPDSIHVLARDPGSRALVGYAHLDTADRVEGPSAEMAVSPGARRRGVGATLLDALIEREGARAPHLRLWAHGSDAAAGYLAAARGFHRVRRLVRMRRPLLAGVDPVALPAGVALRPVDPVTDPGPWLVLNARAFRSLPDQAGWTCRDLELRLAEPWFDAEGFLVAVGPDGSLVGSSWTKVHGDGPASHGHEPIGEVYVVGVDPCCRRRGLGRALTLAALHHLRGRGLAAALLYVDAANEPAMTLYGSLQFVPWDIDTLFRRYNPQAETRSGGGRVDRDPDWSGRSPRDGVAPGRVPAT